MINNILKKLDLSSPIPNYRIKQFNTQYYQEAINSWEELSTWPKDLREQLSKKIPFYKLENIKEFESKDKRTIKILATTREGFPVEAVLMRTNDRVTICISCMSGCPVGCEFCATGKLGLNKMLETQEILDQVMYFKRKLRNTNEKITNVVYMGMGEPMLNLDNILESIKILTDPEKVALSPRRLTVSTAGYIPQLKKFINANTRTKLAISLHAPDQDLRDSLMPSASKANRLENLMKTLLEYEKKTNKRITYEYILLKDINDTPEHAKKLAKLLKNRLALVNLINFNPSPSLDFQPSSRKTIKQFQQILSQNGITNTLRFSMGEDVHGACGQLSAR